MPPRRQRRRGASNETLARIVADHAQFRRTDDFRDALQLIQPTPERRAQCEDDVYRAALGVRVAELFQSPSPKIHKAYLLDIVGKVKAVEDALVLPAFVKNQLKLHREFYQKFADTIIVRPGSPRPSNAKQIATHYAHWLLKEYRSRPPGVTSGGTWQKLATILYGNRKADLFDYLRGYRDFARLYAHLDSSHLSGIDNLEAAYRQVR